MDFALVADQNNRAIARLQADRADEAFRLLVKALADVRDRMTVDSEEHTSIPKQPINLETSSDAPEPSSDVSDGWSDSITTISIHSIPMLTNKLSEKSRFFDESTIGVFDRAFIVDTPGEDDDFLIAVILYNMALINHLFSSNSNGLGKALKLYDASLEVMSNSDSTPTGMDLLIMALHNNSAHIHSYNFCTQEARHSLQELEDILATQETSIEDEDYALFYINTVVTLEGKRNSTAAPAA